MGVDSWHLMHESQGHMTRDPEELRRYLKASGHVKIVKE